MMTDNDAIDQRNRNPPTDDDEQCDFDVNVNDDDKIMFFLTLTGMMMTGPENDESIVVVLYSVLSCGFCPFCLFFAATLQRRVGGAFVLLL
jgi:hypothetical protein